MAGKQIVAKNTLESRLTFNLIPIILLTKRGLKKACRKIFFATVGQKHVKKAAPIHKPGAYHNRDTKIMSWRGLEVGERIWHNAERPWTLFYQYCNR